MKRLRDISWGQKDANVEYFTSRRSGKQPVFINAFLERDIDMINTLNSGSHFIIEGLKGAGKTTIMRYLQIHNEDHISDFIVFKDSILDESDLHDFGDNLLIDPAAASKIDHVQHLMRRIILLLLARLVLTNIGNITKYDTDADASFLESIFTKIRSSKTGLISKLAFDAVSGAVQAASAKGLTPKDVVFDAAKAIKRQNDSIADTLVNFLKEKKHNPIRLYIDEIQYGYTNVKSKRQEAILVRDTILSVNSINRTFADAGIDLIVIIAVRTEFLMHPVMASGNISQIVSASGIILSWETDNFNNRHPMFELAARRVVASGYQSSMSGAEFCQRFLPNENISEFLECMWSQPRDIIRFFDLATKQFGAKFSLMPAEVDSVFRRFARESWEEMKSSLAATFSESALQELEIILRVLAPKVFDGTLNLTYKSAIDFCQKLSNTIKRETGEKISAENIFLFLYTIGLFYTVYTDKNGQKIYYRHWRGNKFPFKDGSVMLHRSIARAFS